MPDFHLIKRMIADYPEEVFAIYYAAYGRGTGKNEPPDGETVLKDFQGFNQTVRQIVRNTLVLPDRQSKIILPGQ